MVVILQRFLNEGFMTLSQICLYVPFHGTEKQITFTSMHLSWLTSENELISQRNTTLHIIKDTQQSHGSNRQFYDSANTRSRKESSFHVNDEFGTKCIAEEMTLVGQISRKSNERKLDENQ